MGWPHPKHLDSWWFLLIFLLIRPDSTAAGCPKEIHGWGMRLWRSILVESCLAHGHSGTENRVRTAKRTHRRLVDAFEIFQICFAFHPWDGMWAPLYSYKMLKDWASATSKVVLSVSSEAWLVHQHCFHWTSSGSLWHRRQDPKPLDSKATPLAWWGQC